MNLIVLLLHIPLPGQANLPKEISDYLNKMGARIPHIKPGRATIEYLTKIQASTRFWGIFIIEFVVLTILAFLACQYFHMLVGFSY